MRIILRESLPIFFTAPSSRIPYIPPFRGFAPRPNAPDSACKTANIDVMNFQSAPSRRSLRSNPSKGTFPTKRSTCHFARNNMFSGHLQNQSIVVRAFLQFRPKCAFACAREAEIFSSVPRVCYMKDQFVYAQIIPEQLMAGYPGAQSIRVIKI